MKITILGSGTLLSDYNRKPASFLLRTGYELALLDMGPGILYQLKYLKINLLKIRTIFITHFHLDHCADIFPLLMTRYLLQNQSNKDFKIWGPKGTNHWFKTLAQTQGGWLHESLPLIYEMGELPMTWAGYEITSCPTRHTKESIAYKFRGMKSYFFSGDTDFNPELIEFANKADVAFLECSHPNQNKINGHLTPLETGRFASEANVNRLIVTHLYPDNDQSGLEQNIAQTYNGSITIGRDLMDID